MSIGAMAVDGFGQQAGTILTAKRVRVVFYDATILAYAVG